jgi:hypothetical protein
MNREDTTSSPIEEITENDLKSLENRGEILLNEAREAYNIPIASIESINVKISSLIQILTALGGIGIVVIIFLFDNEYHYSVLSIFLGCLSSVFWFVSFIILSYSIHLKSYKSVKFFEHDRFEKLCNMDSYDLLSDFLHHLKESYEYNKNRCRELVIIYDMAYTFFFIMIMTSIIFIASIIF